MLLRSISALLIEKADAVILFSKKTNLLIRAAKIVDNTVVEMGNLEKLRQVNYD